MVRSAIAADAGGKDHGGDALYAGSLFFGRSLLGQLQIELARFKIGGGLILLQFGFSMILIAIAVQFMVGGLLEVFPGWGAP